MSLVLKLLLTPLLISAASLAGRRWGAAVGGWLVGLPLTSAPVAVILGVEHGTGFAAAAVVGIVGGVASQAAFAVAYAHAARRTGAATSAMSGTLAFAAATVVLNAVAIPLAAMLFVALAALVAGVWLIPEPPRRTAPAAVRTPRWDLPARIAVATAFVAAVTGVAGLAGPRLAGLITPFPIYAAVLTVFAHRHLGVAAAAVTLRGLLIGLLGFTAFFAALGVSLPRLGWTAFLIAPVATLAVQAWSFRRVRPSPLPAAPA